MISTLRRSVSAVASATISPKNYGRKTTLRYLLSAGVVWWMIQTFYVPSDPAILLLRQRRSQNKRPFRMFGPVGTHDDVDRSNSIHLPAEKDETYSFQFYTREEQRQFLVDFGGYCQRSFTKSSENLLLNRFDSLPEAYAIELWKYCVLYTGIGNVYLDLDNITPLVTWADLLSRPSSNIAIEIIQENEMFDRKQTRIHHSFLQVAKYRSKVCSNMMRLVTESKSLDPIRLSELMGMYATNDKQMWRFSSAQCQWLGDHDSVSADASILLPVSKQRALGQQCPLQGPCCQAWTPEEHRMPSILIRDPYPPLTGRLAMTNVPRPFIDTMDEAKLVMPARDVPYIATVREEPTGETPSTTLLTPNFFDILAENNCLPKGRECFRCLKSSKDGHADSNACQRCQSDCGCYCNALCRIRPPPKPVTAKWFVRPPIHRKDAKLIPRIIHQTWYEPITKSKYPNMSRLIESFKQSGWEYNFYDDDQAGQFIATHFPPQVKEAYDAIIPGAFKADLFRYCVLLIRGGVYSDMDVLLESNLDDILDGSIGFLTAQDEPGEAAGHRSCLWNGLMASAPAHPFLMKTIETVVNNIRNRFTSIDYDDMLCPDPILSVSHTTDMLFTCGPCILGASINKVLRRHPQTSFEHGELDFFETERSHAIGSGIFEDVTVSGGSIFLMDTEDPRLSIPGRSILLKQNKQDMGAHRFTFQQANIVVASTDLPDYDDRPKSLVHYSKTHEKFGIYGLNKLYVDDQRANEEIQFVMG